MRMYQPRRVSDPIETVSPIVTESTPFVSGPRRAEPTLSERVLSRGSVALAVVTASATAAAVIIGSSGGSAAALGASAAPIGDAGHLTAAAADAAAPVTRTLTASQLAAPAVAKFAQTADEELLSVSRLYTKAALKVRAKADDDAKLLGSVKQGVRVSATAEVDGQYRRIEWKDGFAWVLAAKLSDTAPAVATVAAGTTNAPCSRGSKVEGRLRQDTIHIYRSVCALFPAVNAYGGWRAGGLPFHKNGRALDIMLTPGAESALGHRIANYLIKHYKEFNVDHIIFEQHIWTPSTPHWRHMADRGGTTANHYDHVHVAIRA